MSLANLDQSLEASLEQAARAIRGADALLLTAGAGLGVDSGLPDFRGDEGFWRAYPPLARLGVSFVDMANPRWFEADPELAWGFYGHRLNLYRAATPHAGFGILRDWAASKPNGGFVFTSNVDGHFEQAGFDPQRLVECHGSIHFWQCSEPCGEDLWPADEADIVIDEDTLRAEPPLPACPHCGAIARPNVLMFHDGPWLWSRTESQQERFRQWLTTLAGKSLTIVEVGAGTGIPTVRNTSEEFADYGATLVRINPDEPQAPSGSISLPLGALEALLAIQDLRAAA